MIIESFIKSSLLPALFLSLLCLSVGFLKGLTKDLFQGSLFALALIVGIYQIKGGYGQPLAGGMESLLLLPLVFLTVLPLLVFSRFGFFIKAIVVLILVWFISFPLLGGQFFSGEGFHLFDPRLGLSLGSDLLKNSVVRIGLAFGLLGLSLWSFSERQFEKGWWATLLVACTVSWGAAALYFLFRSSALISQCFGVFATICGFFVVVSMFFGWRLSARVAAAYLVALPVLLLLLGVLYVDVPPLTTMALCLPFFIAAVRPLLPFSRGGVIKEIIISAVLCVLAVAWVIYHSYKISGPILM